MNSFNNQKAFEKGPRSLNVEKNMMKVTDMQKKLDSVMPVRHGQVPG